MSVRSFVSHTPYLENRASDFDDFFAQSYILMSLKNVPGGFLKIFFVFEILAKNGQFLPFLAIFTHKNQVFGHFLRIRTSDLSKTWSETWDSCFESFNGSVVSRKILVLAIFGSKIHCLW